MIPSKSNAEMGRKHTGSKDETAPFRFLEPLILPGQFSGP